MDEPVWYDDMCLCVWISYNYNLNAIIIIIIIDNISSCVIGKNVVCCVCVRYVANMIAIIKIDIVAHHHHHHLSGDDDDNRSHQCSLFIHPNSLVF